MRRDPHLTILWDKLTRVKMLISPAVLHSVKSTLSVSVLSHIYPSLTSRSLGSTLFSPPPFYSYRIHVRYIKLRDSNKSQPVNFIGRVGIWIQMSPVLVWHSVHWYHKGFAGKKTKQNWQDYAPHIRFFILLCSELIPIDTRTIHLLLWQKRGSMNMIQHISLQRGMAPLRQLLRHYPFILFPRVGS